MEGPLDARCGLHPRTRHVEQRDVCVLVPWVRGAGPKWGKGQGQDWGV